MKQVVAWSYKGRLYHSKNACLRDEFDNLSSGSKYGTPILKDLLKNRERLIEILKELEDEDTCIRDD